MNKKNLYWIELNTQNLKHNIQTYRNRLSLQSKIAAVIKSNAYGHGIIQIAKELEQDSNIHTLCVVNSEEGLLLRKEKISKPIMIIGVINSEIEKIVACDLEPTIYDLSIAQELNDAAKQQQKTCTIHIKVDTGLSRMGILPEQLPEYLEAISKLKNIRIGSIYSHLAAPANIDASLKQEQKLLSLEHNFPTHISASKSPTKSLNQNHALTRLGIGMYGYTNDDQVELRKLLKPVLSLKSRIVFIKTVPAQSSIGYDHTFITKRETRIALLPIGHGDGINLGISNKGRVIICNTIAPMVGKINMNYIIVDVTDIPECTTEDIAIIIGRSKDQEVSLYDWAKHTNLSPTHVVTNLKPHIPRICV